MPSQLSEAQVSQIYRTAGPLENPNAFITDVTNALAAFRELGDGLIYRVCRDARMQYWTPPEFPKHQDCSKYR
jgi:hypothetical protein